MMGRGDRRQRDRVIGFDTRRWCIAASGGAVVVLVAAGGLTPFHPFSPGIRLSAADAATTTPTTAPGGATMAKGMAGGMAGGTAGAATPVGSTTRPTTEPAFRMPRNPAISPGEWENVVRFMKKNSPARLSFIHTLPDGPRRSGMAAAAVQDYHAYERARSDPDLSRTLLTRLKLEDELFDLAARIRSAPAEEQKQLSNDLRQKVGQWTDATFQERQLRIERLEQTLDKQRKTLAEDKARRDVIVNDRYHEVMRNVHLASTRPSTQPTPTTRP